MEDLTQPLGYPLEQHFVTTRDGYVLGVYRIPHGRQNEGNNNPRPPVLLLHGLLDSSGTWIINQPEQSLGFILADAGYDVWLGNSRGNAFSRNHTGLPLDSAAFWDFTFNDMADYDFPDMVEYIVQATNYQKLAFIGHSQGTTQAFAALASHPPLQHRIALFVALGPAAFVRYTDSIPLLILAQLHSDELFEFLGQHEFFPARKATADIFGQVCRASALACVSILTAICGFNEHNLNLTRLPVYVEYAPSGTSVKNMAAWAQLIRQSSEQGKSLFRRYDYGSECFTRSKYPQNCNRREYGQDRPPSYDLSGLANVPIALFSGVQDKLADPVDVQTLREALPKGAVVYDHTELSFQHIDFTWSILAAKRIYPHVLRLLDTYLYSSYRGSGSTTNVS